MNWKRILLAIIISGFLFGCVSQKPARIYYLTIFISGGEKNCVVIRTEAMVDKKEDIKTSQDISPDIDIDAGLIP